MPPHSPTQRDVYLYTSSDDGSLKEWAQKNKDTTKILLSYYRSENKWYICGKENGSGRFVTKEEISSDSDLGQLLALLEPEFCLSTAEEQGSAMPLKTMKAVLKLSSGLASWQKFRQETADYYRQSTASIEKVLIFKARQHLGFTLFEYMNNAKTLYKNDGFGRFSINGLLTIYEGLNLTECEDLSHEVINFMLNEVGGIRLERLQKVISAVLSQAYLEHKPNVSTLQETADRYYREENQRCDFWDSFIWSIEYKHLPLWSYYSTINNYRTSIPNIIQQALYEIYLRAIDDNLEAHKKTALQSLDLLLTPIFDLLLTGLKIGAFSGSATDKIVARNHPIEKFNRETESLRHLPFFPIVELTANRYERLGELVTQAQTTFAAYVNTEIRRRMEDFKNTIEKQAKELMLKRLQLTFSDMSSLDTAQATYDKLLEAIVKEDALRETFCQQFYSATQSPVENRTSCDKIVVIPDQEERLNYFLKSTMLDNYTDAIQTALFNFKEKLSGFFKAIFDDTEDKIRKAPVLHIEPAPAPRQIFHSDLNDVREIGVRREEIRRSALEGEEKLLKEFRDKTNQSLQLIPKELRPEMQITIAVTESKMIALIESRKQQKTPRPSRFFDGVQEKMTKLDATTFKL